MRRAWAIPGFVVVAAAACAVANVAIPSARAAAAAAAPLTIKVQPARTFTPTGLEVRAGDTVTIRAGGTLTFRPEGVAPVAPAGIPWGRPCNAIAQTVVHTPWPLPGKACWSLIAKIGTAPAFEVGRAKSFKASVGGQLLLGINDNIIKDNHGGWTAVVSVTTPAGVPVTTVPRPKAVAASHHSSSSFPTIALMAVGLAVVALLLFFVVARRRRPAASPVAKQVAPAPAPAPAPRVPVAVAPVVASATVTSPRTDAVPFDPESTDVNIFRVELPGGTSLHVGYSFFPDDTTLLWRVSSDGVTRASGSFITQGGGGAQHFETLPLDPPLAPGEAAVDVSFSWTIGEVPFGYSVRRDPGGS